MSDQRNLLLAIVLSIMIIFAYDVFFPSQPVSPLPPQQQQAMERQTVDSIVPTAPQTAKAPAVAKVEASLLGTSAEDRAKALEKDPRLSIDSDAIHGSIRLTGARLDDLTLKHYKEELSDDSDNVVLLSPTGSLAPYYLEYGFTTQDSSQPMPDAKTLWTTTDTELTPETPVTLTWNNGKGLLFARKIALDENYMFTVTQTVENTTSTDITLFPYGLVSRIGDPESGQRQILHEGPIGVFEDTLEEIDYESLREDGDVTFHTTGGWLGMTDKYWLAALVFDQKTPNVTGRFTHRKTAEGINRYQVDYLSAPLTLKAGEEKSITNRSFTGAKEIRLLDRYAEEYGINRFDLSVDFGWYYFLTKPFFYLLSKLFDLIGNFGLAILAVTVLLRLAMYPLADKSFKNMSKMKKIHPKVKALQEKFAEDRVRLNQEMMALYKKEQINPAAGCLPMLIQIPIFFSLYKVLYISIEMRHAPFYGWIKDLSVPDPTSIFTLFGMVPWNPPQFLDIGIWPIIMGLTMYLQQKLNPKPTDPSQAKMMAFLPLIFTFMLGSFPAGLVIYWAWSNTLSIIQQRAIMRKMGVDPS